MPRNAARAGAAARQASARSPPRPGSERPPGHSAASVVARPYAGGRRARIACAGAVRISRVSPLRYRRRAPEQPPTGAHSGPGAGGRGGRRTGLSGRQPGAAGLHGSGATTCRKTPPAQGLPPGGQAPGGRLAAGRERPRAVRRRASGVAWPYAGVRRGASVRRAGVQRPRIAAAGATAGTGARPVPVAAAPAEADGPPPHRRRCGRRTGFPGGSPERRAGTAGWCVHVPRSVARRASARGPPRAGSERPPGHSAASVVARPYAGGRRARIAWPGAVRTSRISASQSQRRAPAQPRTGARTGPGTGTGTAVEQLWPGGSPERQGVRPCAEKRRPAGERPGPTSRWEGAPTGPSSDERGGTPVRRGPSGSHCLAGRGAHQPHLGVAVPAASAGAAAYGRPHGPRHRHRHRRRTAMAGR